jgi:alpha-amylase
MLNYARYELGCNKIKLTLKQHWLTGENWVNSENHPAIGAGVHQQITATPYLFTRTLTKVTLDKVLIGL